jgi:hypothetical protein
MFLVSNHRYILYLFPCTTSHIEQHKLMCCDFLFVTKLEDIFAREYIKKIQMTLVSNVLCCYRHHIKDYMFFVLLFNSV